MDYGDLLIIVAGFGVLLLIASLGLIDYNVHTAELKYCNEKGLSWDKNQTVSICTDFDDTTIKIYCDVEGGRVPLSFFNEIKCFEVS